MAARASCAARAWRQEREFLFTWKFDNFKRTVGFGRNMNFSLIESPTFQVEVLENSKWVLELHFEEGDLGDCVRFQLRRIRPTYLNRISVYFQIEVTNSAGDILKTSDIFPDIFPIDSSPKPFKFYLEQADMGAHFFLCRMISPCITLPSSLSSISTIGVEAETHHIDHHVSFCWTFKYSDFSECSVVVEKISVKGIPMDVTFSYGNQEILIYILPKIDIDTSHFMLFYMALLNKDKSTVVEKSHNFKFDVSKSSWQFPIFIVEQDIKKADCFADKEIKINLDVHYVYFTCISKINYNECGVQNKNQAKDVCLVEQLRDMFNNKTYADVKICVGDDTFFAHKCLLATRSPVFRAMFDQDMLESKSGTIDIHDVESQTMRIFLVYLYTGIVDGINDEIASSLLIVADKYQVSSLTKKCSTFLKSVLSFDIVLSVLSIADMVNEEELKIFAIEYITKNSTKVLSSPEWPQWLKTNPAIASEVLLKISNKFDSTSGSVMHPQASLSSLVSSSGMSYQSPSLQPRFPPAVEWPVGSNSSYNSAQAFPNSMPPYYIRSVPQFRP